MIAEKIGKSGQKIYTYKQLENQEMKKLFNDLIQLLKDFANANSIDFAKINYNYKLVNQINIRVDKRKDYFIIYHDETYINEAREAALLAYWVVKFKPFYIISDDAIDYNININCAFAAYIIFSAVSEYIDRDSKKTQKLNITEAYRDKFLYALKYWDLSKESLMLIAETLCLSRE